MPMQSGLTSWLILAAGFILNAPHISPRHDAPVLAHDHVLAGAAQPGTKARTTVWRREGDSLTLIQASEMPVGVPRDTTVRNFRMVNLSPEDIKAARKFLAQDLVGTQIEQQTLKRQQAATTNGVKTRVMPQDAVEFPYDELTKSGGYHIQRTIGSTRRFSVNVKETNGNLRMILSSFQEYRNGAWYMMGSVARLYEPGKPAMVTVMEYPDGRPLPGGI
ncbi:hypothetical protein [Gemmatimonas aurantiaca]|uniref:hypothetical protein n=1 Tax=Gemmatimonas aurantiaca TaxID=173480 RepID=UPI00301E14CF